MKRMLTGLNNAKVKIAVCVFIVVLLGIIQSKEILSVFAILIFAVSALTHKKTNTGLATLIFIVAFASIMGIIQALTIGVHELLRFKLVFFSISVYEEGLNRGILSFLKISGSMFTVLMLMRTIEIGEFIKALKWYRLPDAFLEVMTFTIKFIYIFRDEAFSVIKAQKSRLGYKGFWRSVGAMSSVAGIVLTRAYDRSKVLSKSMQSRGYNGNT